MLGHVKNWASARALTSSLPDSEVAQPFLLGLLPDARCARPIAEHLGLHPLRREIIATAAVNHLVNHAGVSFLHRVMALSERELGDVVEAYLLTDCDSRAGDARTAISQGPGSFADVHAQLVEIEEALEHATIRLLKNESVDLEERAERNTSNLSRGHNNVQTVLVQVVQVVQVQMVQKSSEELMRFREVRLLRGIGQRGHEPPATHRAATM